MRNENGTVKYRKKQITDIVEHELYSSVTPKPEPEHSEIF